MPSFPDTVNGVLPKADTFTQVKPDNYTDYGAYALTETAVSHEKLRSATGGAS